MAAHKRKRSLKQRSSQLTRFPEVNGKVVEEIEANEEAVVILFKDRTALSFDFDASITVFAELSNRGTGDWRSIKRWPPLRGKPGMV